MLIHRNDERRIDDPRTQRVQEIENKYSGGDPRVFERPDRARARFTPLNGRIGPLEDLLVCDRTTGARETHERLGDVQPSPAVVSIVPTPDEGGRGENAPHELPYETEHERPRAVDNVGTLNSDEMHSVLFPELDCVVGVLDLLESGQRALVRRDPNVLLFLASSSAAAVAAVQRRSGRARGVPSRFGDAPPDDRPGQDLVKRLENDQPVLDVLKQVEHPRLDAERVEPEREHARFTLALGVEILDCAIVFGFLLVEGGQARPCVEQVGDECEVEARVAGDEGGWGEVFAATDGGGILEDLFGTLAEVARLEGGAGAFVGFELVEKDGVVFAVGYVAAKVVYSGAKSGRVGGLDRKGEGTFSSNLRPSSGS